MEFAPLSPPSKEVPTAADVVASPKQVYIVQVLGVSMSVQAAILAVAGLVLSVTMILLYPNWISIIASMAILLGMLFASYAVNCTVVGHCQVLAWLFTILYGSYAMLAIIGIVQARHQGLNPFDVAIPSSKTSSVKRVLPKSK
jgi:hypothetical protein